jgi:hypothetical protein
MPQQHHKSDPLSVSQRSRNSLVALIAERNRVPSLQSRPTIAAEWRFPSSILHDANGSLLGSPYPPASPTSRETRRRDLLRILNEAVALFSDDGSMNMVFGDDQEDDMDSPNGL